MPSFPVPKGDDLDAKAAALRNNPECMAYLASCKERAHTRPTKSLEEMRKLYDKPEPRRKPAKKRKTA